MIIDIILAGLMILAIIKGFRKGLVMAIFSIVAFIAGLLIAIKFSSVIAAEFAPLNRWVPFISFFLLFLVVSWAVKTLGHLVKKAVQLIMVGWLDQLGGIIFYGLLYVFIFSLFLFFALQLKIFSETTIEKSVFLPYLEPIGPKIINGIGKLIPIFGDMFKQLNNYFSQTNHN